MKSIVFAILFIFLFISSAWATEYYVDPVRGNDTWTGTSVKLQGASNGPKKTLNSLSSKASAGDIIYLRGGTYGNDQYWFTNKGIGNEGTKSQPITITNYKTETPVFKSDGAWDVVFTIARDWIVLDGLTFDTCKGANIIVLLLGNHVEIKNCEVRNTTTWIRLDNPDGAHGTYNKIHHNVASNIGGPGKDGKGGGAFVFIRGGKFNDVYENEISDIGHAAIEVEDYPNFVQLGSYNKIRNNYINQSYGGGGIYINRRSYYNLIQNNIIENIGQHPEIKQNKAGILITGHHNTVRKNLILNYGVSGTEIHRGIYLASYSSFGNKNCTNNLVYNNLIYKGFGVPIYYREAGLRKEGYVVKDNLFANNVVYQAPTIALKGPSFVGMYNPESFYALYLGTYVSGPWDNFANGNKFVSNYFENFHYFGYFAGKSGFGMKIDDAQKKFPDAVSENFSRGDPGFMDPIVYNFQLKPTSMLIDAGVIVKDPIWGTLPYNGSAPDIGPREYDPIGGTLPYNESAPDIGPREYSEEKLVPPSGLKILR